jgi:hypothetical protein
MIDLKQIAGFNLQLDPTRNKLIFDINGHTSFEEDIVVSLSDLFPVLLNKNIQYPQKIYRKYKNVGTAFFEKFNAYFDLYLIPYGLLGIEYIKSHIYYTPYEGVAYTSVVQCYSGQMILLMQKHAYTPVRELDYFTATKLEDVKIIECKVGNVVLVPAGYYYTFINIGNEPVVFSRLSLINSSPINYEALKKEKGMAFFIISKNAKVEKVSNPKYKFGGQESNSYKVSDASKWLKEDLFSDQDIISAIQSNKFLESIDQILLKLSK